MKFLTASVLAVALANAASVDLAKRESPLDVALELVGETTVRASVTNTGSEALKVLKSGSILDEVEVEKSEVFAGSKKVEFDGIRKWIDTSLLKDSDFQVIGAGETVEVEFDVAYDHDLSSGGSFDVSSVGVLSLAAADSTTITATTGFRSNTLSVSVDGAAAAKARREWHAAIHERAIIQTDCTGVQRTAVVNALNNCRALAVAAATAASSGPAARMTEFFKSATTATRNTVSTVFNRIATECGSTTSGNARQYCSDRLGACSGGTVAYTVPAQAYMVNCPTWFSGFAATSNACRGTSQSSVTLHEATHLTSVKGTSDYNCYGYACTTGLPASQNLNHADTYHLFAQAVRANC